jgi:hypothetical protein
MPVSEATYLSFEATVTNKLSPAVLSTSFDKYQKIFI